ncbi:hypothetical protein P0Y35_16435 [Kiritimatiellaeota bacterium B1221]|nr:hypothetical protein [Kiritimatiellaeota bacterium B1221]
MKKLFPLIVLTAILGPILLLLLSKTDLVGISAQEIATTSASLIGKSMIFVGMVIILLSAIMTDNKTKIYQGAFCTLLGIAISAHSLPAFIAAIILVVWMDYTGRPLT